MTRDSGCTYMYLEVSVCETVSVCLPACLPACLPVCVCVGGGGGGGGVWRVWCGVCVCVWIQASYM